MSVSPTMEQRLKALDGQVLPQDYFTALQVAAQAQRMISDLPGLPEVDDQLAPLTAGKILDSWVDQVVTRKTAEPVREIRRNVLLSVLNDARSRSSYMYQEQRDGFLAALHGELQNLLGEAEQVVVDLAGVTSATEAVANDVAPQWKRLIALTEDYQTLREHQMRHVDVMTQFEIRPQDGGEEDHASDLYLKNLDDIWPMWRTPSKQASRIIHVDGTKPRLEPWPSEPTELLRWLVTSTAQPWIPTSSQLQQHLADRRARMNPMKKLGQTRSDQQPTPRQTFGVRSLIG